jgi:hypothetical protein
MTESNYSKLITPEDYNNLMANQHLYIRASDKIILKQLREQINVQCNVGQVIEIGSGPMRISRDILSTLQASGRCFRYGLIELDSNFVQYSQDQIAAERLPINLIQSDISSYQAYPKIDIAISQGFHHHVDSGYLQSLYSNMNSGGCYILGDEFLGNYEDEDDRKIKAIVWYSHIISRALDCGFFQLAREEVKTLLDDINPNKLANPKTEDLIQRVLSSTPKIEKNTKPENLIIRLLGEIEESISVTNKPDMVLSRGDYKISKEVFTEQARAAGFDIVAQKSIGDLRDNMMKGSLSVFTLRK